METLIFRYDLYEKLQNCSFINVDSVPLEKRQHPKLGLLLMTLAIILEFLYIPCFISLNRIATNNACYKIMRYLGIVDLFVLPLNGMLTGYMAIEGYVFCTSPKFIYITGSIALGLYCMVSFASVVLACNRCLEMIWPSLNEKLFATRLIKYWLTAATLYGLYFILFTVPIKFNGIYMTWFFSPYVGYTNLNAELYHNNWHSFNNTVEAAALITLYTTFVVVVIIRSLGNKSITSTTHSSSKRQSQIRSFFQVFLISVINSVSCAIYVLMNFIPVNEVLIIMGTFGWLFIHGLPPIIYLTLNRTIRRDTIKMLGLQVCCGGADKIKPIKTTTASGVHPDAQATEMDHDEP